MENNEKYTQLAKEGKFDQLPNTCEFSEPVELEVWELHEQEDDTSLNQILGKFKGKYISNYEEFWNYAQLPTQKNDFSEFKQYDLLEIKDNEDNECVGYFIEDYNKIIEVSYTKGQRLQVYQILKENIKSITKIK